MSILNYSFKLNNTKEDESFCGSCPMLNDSERKQILTYVREILYCLSGKESFLIETPKRGHFNRYGEAVVSVSLWVNGVLRGCSSPKKQPLGIALEEAAFDAMWDIHFKPVAKEEFLNMRIEVTLLAFFRTVSVRMLKESAEFDLTMGYRLSYKTHVGWFLPNIFNTIRFRELDNFLETLIEREAGLKKEFLSKSTITVFRVDNFIETEKKDQILLLSGPLVQNTKKYIEFDLDFLRDLEMVLHRAARHLLKIQESDGNIPAVTDPLLGRGRSVDWIRLSFVVKSLAFFGQVVGETKYLLAAEKAREYIRKYGYDHLFISKYDRTLCHVYYAEYLLVIGMVDEAKKISLEVADQLDIAFSDPILLLQTASLLLSFEEEKFLQRAKVIFESVWLLWNRLFQQKKKGFGIELVRFSEGIAVAEELFCITGDALYQERSERMRVWLVDQQFSDGSFPIMTGSNLAYTRGTGKIFEVLTLKSEKNQKSILGAFTWLKKMQYTEENLYFVQKNYQEKFLGGFRHDVYNQESWIDATGHVLFGGARLLSVLTKKTGSESTPC
jgi:AMMECR1 domain-containing protein